MYASSPPCVAPQKIESRLSANDKKIFVKKENYINFLFALEAFFDTDKNFFKSLYGISDFSLLKYI